MSTPLLGLGGQNSAPCPMVRSVSAHFQFFTPVFSGSQHSEAYLPHSSQKLFQQNRGKVYLFQPCKISFVRKQHCWQKRGGGEFGLICCVGGRRCTNCSIPLHYPFNRFLALPSTQSGWGWVSVSISCQCSIHSMKMTMMALEILNVWAASLWRGWLARRQKMVRGHSISET